MSVSWIKSSSVAPTTERALDAFGKCGQARLANEGSLDPPVQVLLHMVVVKMSPQPASVLPVAGEDTLSEQKHAMCRPPLPGNTRTPDPLAQQVSAVS